MAEMPIEQDYNRHTKPVTSNDGQDLASIEALPEDAEFVENADGSVTVLSKSDEEDRDEGFHANLAESLPPSELSRLAIDLLDLIENDKEARKRRDEQYAEGIKRTGLGNEAPGGAQFDGASKTVHPVLAEGCIDFAARAMKELFPANGPVKTHIIGKTTDDKVEKADRKKDFMNYQLTGTGKHCIIEYRSELEQMLTQLPLGGSQFFKIWYDERASRQRAEFVPIDDFLLPYHASNLQTAQRATHVQLLSRLSFEGRVASGLYIDANLADPPKPDDQTASSKASDKVEGKTDEMAYNEDGLRRVYEIYLTHPVEGEDAKPYIVTVDEASRKILAIYRNWAEHDEGCEQLQWVVDFNFIPWRGAYAVGLPHLIGTLSGALTGALRAILDSAHINNAATMLKLKGARTSGQNVQVEVTEVCEIEGPTGIDDIRKLAMPMPFNPPSQVLFQLLDWLVGQAKGVVATAEESIANANSNMPVGTALALIEQGSQVFSSIHSRLHDSQRRVLAIIHRLNGEYLDDQVTIEELGGLLVTKQDFQGPMDIQPVSDPNVFSDSQRYAQLQAMMQLAEKYPQYYKVDQLNERALRLLNVPNFEEVLNKAEEPQQCDPVTENRLASTGARPIKAYPDQDHVAHLASHTAFLSSPLFCLNPIMANPTLPALLNHCREHLLMEYEKRARAALAAGVEVNPDQVEATNHAMALVDQDLAATLGPMMQHIAEAAKQSAQLIPPPPPADPVAAVNLQIGMAEIQRKAQESQQNNQLKLQLAQAENARAQAEQQADQAKAAAERQLAEFQAQVEAQRVAAENERAERELFLNKLVELVKDENDNHTKVVVAQINALKQGMDDTLSQQNQQVEQLVQQLQTPGFFESLMQRFRT